MTLQYDQRSRSYKNRVNCGNPSKKIRESATKLRGKESETAQRLGSETNNNLPTNARMLLKAA